MPLRLYFHPLSSYCQKILIALYENGTAFTPEIVNLGDAADREAFLKLWPIGKFPVIRDETTGTVVAESSTIIEYLDRYYPGPRALIPQAPEQAWEVRRWDRILDLHVSDPMQKIVGDRRRPADARDPYGVGEARTRLQAAYGILDAHMRDRTWAAAHDFTMADCGAAPALYYANRVLPFGKHRNLAAYFERLAQRPSYARAFEESKPYLHFFPQE